MSRALLPQRTEVPWDSRDGARGGDAFQYISDQSRIRQGEDLKEVKPRFDDRREIYRQSGADDAASGFPIRQVREVAQFGSGPVPETFLTG
jgi:hypothetical protein